MNARRHIRIVAGTESGVGPIVLETIERPTAEDIERAVARFPQLYASRVDLLQRFEERIAENDRRKFRARIWLCIFASVLILSAVAIHYVVERETTARVAEAFNG